MLEFFTNLFNKDTMEEVDESEPKVPDFSKIENPAVRDYMQKKYQKEQDLAAAKDKQDWSTYGSIAGKFLEGMSTPTTVRLENRTADLGKEPKRSVSETFKYDSSLGDKVIGQGIKDAEQDLTKVKTDFNDNAAMDQYSRSEADFADENNPDSEVSKQYQMLAKKFVPAGSYEGVSAAKLKKLLPPLEKAYEIDARRRAANAPQNEWFSTGKVDQNGNLILLNRKTGEMKSAGVKLGVKPVVEKAPTIDAQKKGSTAAQGMENEIQYNEAVNKGKDKKDYDPTSYMDFIDNSSWAPNLIKSDASIEAAAARDAWVENFLRDASGAAIPKDERKQYYEIYFPKMGDSAKTVENKRQLRKLKMDENAKMGKRDIGGGEQPSTTTPSAGKVTVSNGKETFTIDQADLQDAINDGFKVVK